MRSVVGKIKSQFDLNHDLMHIVIRFRPQKIRFEYLRLEIWFDLLFLEIRFGSKWSGYESRSSPGTAEWSDMPRSIFSNFTHQVVHHCLHWSFATVRTTCRPRPTSWNRSDKTIQQLSGHHHSPKVTLSYLPGQKISKCPSNIGLGWTLVQCCHKGQA